MKEAILEKTLRKMRISRIKKTILSYTNEKTNALIPPPMRF